jgi:hypothetical protein
MLERDRAIYGPFALDHDEKLVAVITKLKSLGAKVKHRRRKLVRREKDYLTLIGAGNHRTYTTVILPAICKHFPDAYMTSGGFASETCNSVKGGWEPRFNITLALEK